MALVGHGRFVVVLSHVGGSKLSDIKLVLQREPSSRKTWCLAGSTSSNAERVDAFVRDLHEDTGIILTLDVLNLLSDAPVRVALPNVQRVVYAFSAYVQVPYVTTHLRTPTQLEQVVTAQSTINLDGSYVVPETINIDGRPLRHLRPLRMGYFRR
jgi:hypothetical protein